MRFCMFVILLSFLFLQSCAQIKNFSGSQSKSKDEVISESKSKPSIYDEEIYWKGKVIGKVEHIGAFSSPIKSKKEAPRFIKLLQPVNGKVSVQDIYNFSNLNGKLQFVVVLLVQKRAEYSDYHIFVEERNISNQENISGVSFFKKYENTVQSQIYIYDDLSDIVKEFLSRFPEKK